MGNSVIVIGAGPVGLMLAGELRLAGAEVVVYEERLTPTGESRGVGFTARATEIFRQRKLFDRFENAEITARGHFGGIPLDFSVLPGSHFGARGVPQYRVEEVLQEWVDELGGEVRRGWQLRDLRQTTDGVTAVFQTPTGLVEQSGAYLVGCDGGHSSVRQLAGFDFPGTDALRRMYLADVLGAQLRPRPIGERVPGGMVMCGPLGDGVDRVIVCPTGTPPRSDQRADFAEVAAIWERLTGESLAGARASWVSTFTDATRQVSEYRRGRVLLAGDAAHIHLPAGGQGMSLGIQDAMNLGWKLAATVGGRAPAGLLDSYHSERHPVAARVLRNTVAQGTLYLSGEDIEPLRAVMTELMDIPEVGRHLSGMVSGLDICYDVGCTGHPLIGRRLPDGEFLLAEGGVVRTAELLSRSRGVLIYGRAAEPTGLPADRHDLVEPIAVTRFDAGLLAEYGPIHAVLVRPDGYVGWAGSSDAGLAEALRRWFGPARAGVLTRP